jgi:hypothetical protein
VDPFRELFPETSYSKLLLNRIDTPLEFEEKDEKKQSNPHIDLILDSISEVKCVSCKQ